MSHGKKSFSSAFFFSKKPMNEREMIHNVYEKLKLPSKYDVELISIHPPGSMSPWV